MSSTQHENPIDRATQAALAISVSDAIANPCALSMQALNELVQFAAWHADGPKLDILGSEKALGLSFNAQPTTYSVDNGIATIEVDGLLFAKSNLFTRLGGGSSAQYAASQVSEAAHDSSVKSILVSIDSPGGSVFGAPELAEAIYSAGQQKPTVVHSGAMLLGTAYWAGAAANAVYVSGPTVAVGAIGVVARHVHSPAAGTTEIVAGRFKTMASPNAALTQEGAAHLQARTDYLYRVFLERVGFYRGTTAAVAHERMADGRTFIGQQAIDVGLADAMAPKHELLAQMARDPSAFAKRRRLAAHRAALHSTNLAPVLRPVTAVHSASITTSIKPITPISKAEQVEVAAAHAHKTGLTFIESLKSLGFAS